jgi:hypothetical protein
METIHRQKFVGKALLFVGLTFLVASCGGKSSTSSAQSSSEAPIDPATALLSFKSSLKNYAAKTNQLYRLSPLAHESKDEYDLGATFYTKETVTDTPVTSSGAVAASASTSVVNHGPFTFGANFDTENAEAANLYFNNLDDAVGNDFLAALHLSYFSFVYEKDESPVSVTDKAFDGYFNSKALYLNLSKAPNLYTAINSAVQSTEGNANWSFPSSTDGKLGKATFPDAVHSSITYQMPLKDAFGSFATALGEDIDSAYQNDESLFSFAKTGDVFTLNAEMKSFSKFYRFVYTRAKDLCKKDASLIGGQSMWYFVNKYFLDPLEKIGNCVTTFDLKLSFDYTGSILNSFTYDFNLATDYAKMQTTFGNDETMPLYVTKLYGKAKVTTLYGSVATIPTPSPDFALYTEIPEIKTSSSSTTPTTSSSSL